MSTSRTSGSKFRASGLPLCWGNRRCCRCPSLVNVTSVAALLQSLCLWLSACHAVCQALLQALPQPAVARNDVEATNEGCRLGLAARPPTFSCHFSLRGGRPTLAASPPTSESVAVAAEWMGTVRRARMPASSARICFNNEVGAGISLIRRICLSACAPPFRFDFLRWTAAGRLGWGTQPCRPRRQGILGQAEATPSSPTSWPKG